MASEKQANVPYGGDDPEVQTQASDEEVYSTGICASGSNGASRKKRLLLVGGVAVLVIVGVAVGVVMGTSGGSGSSGADKSASLEDDPNLAEPSEPTPNPTPGPTSQLYLKLANTIALDNGDEFTNPNSYQSKALEWLENSPFLDEYTDEQIFQRYSLACIYYSTFGVSNDVIKRELPDITDVPGWKFSTNWLTEANECTWHGIKCESDFGEDGDGATTIKAAESRTAINPDNIENQAKHFSPVVQISLYDNRMTGVFPAEVSLLHASLVHLELGQNEYLMAGTFDETSTNEWIGELTSLKKLYYPFCKFYSQVGIPSEIGKLTNLEEYDCAFNVYQGALQGETFTNLKELTWLDISGGMFRSKLPSQMLALPKLEDFFITDSFIEDDVSYLTKLSNLYQHVADQNQGIVGELPEANDMSDKIELLSFSICNITGTIPESYGTTLSNLKKLFVNDNRVYGEVPSTLGQLTGLMEFELQDNDIVGTMPEQVCDNVAQSELDDGTITKLIADCGRSNGDHLDEPTEIVCPLDTCCTACGFEE